ncbi:MAG: hypothetical protein K0R90_401 [Oscillospiraceae bacterium]|jgi:acid phosphatase family membrane protein YuiD|nr:hypothetical protein [Oscillospiraceae bacterium]
MENLRQLLHNYVLTVAMVSWITAQILKTLLSFLKTKEFNAERLVGAGGMPSAHTATVCGLVIAVAKKAGPNSPEFAMAFVLAAVVIYDAMGVRRAAGEQAKVINKIVKSHNEDEDKTNDIESKELKEFLGHTPLEVLGGSLLGILIAMMIPIR